MLKRVSGVLRRVMRCERGGSELIALAIVAALVLLLAFGPGKNMMTKVGGKFTTMGTCVENPNAAGCP